MPEFDLQEALTAMRMAEREGTPVLTLSELAERIGVTSQTVRNHRDELSRHVMVREKEIAGTTVYWEQKHEQADQELSGQRSESRVSRGRYVSNRGEWIDFKTYDVPALRVSDNPEARHYAAKEVLRFLQTQLQFQPVLDSEVPPEVPEDLHDMVDDDGKVPHMAPWFDLDRMSMSDEMALQYLYSIPILESDWYGEVNGLVGLRDFGSKLNAKMMEETGHDLPPDDGISMPDVHEQADADTYRRVYPTVSALADAGEVVDEFASDLHCYRW